MYCNIEQADSLSSATLEIEVDSAVNWIFALIEHGVMAFQNKLRQMDDATMLALGSLLAPYSSLKLFYIKAAFKKKLLEHLKPHWDLNRPEHNLAAHTLRHSKMRVNPFLAEACRTQEMDPTFLIRFLPAAWVLTIVPFTVAFQWEKVGLEGTSMEKVIIYKWNCKDSVEENLVGWDCQPMRQFHCSFCLVPWDLIAVGDPIKDGAPNFYQFLDQLPLFDIL